MLFAYGSSGRVHQGGESGWEGGGWIDAHGSKGRDWLIGWLRMLRQQSEYAGICFAQASNESVLMPVIALLVVV